MILLSRITALGLALALPLGLALASSTLASRPERPPVDGQAVVIPAGRASAPSPAAPAVRVVRPAPASLPGSVRDADDD